MTAQKHIMAIMMTVWVALVPIHPALICVLALPLVDLVLALICAKKEGKPVTSTGLKRTVGKILMYEVATILAFMTEKWLTGAAIPAVKVITGLIGLTELKSCLEHLDELGGSPLFASILNRLAPGQPDSPPSPPQEPPEPPKAA